jgi:uncharacterized oligopeptide transporter (OPT) family protein
MTGRVWFAVRAIAMVLAALVLAHNVIFLAGYRAHFETAMTSLGHDHGWTIAALVSMALAGSLLVVGSLRLLQLRRSARDAGARRLLTEPDRRAFVWRWLVWWVALTLATAVLFVLEENLEVARVHRTVPGIGVLASAAYPSAVAIIAVVALVVSLVAAILGWHAAVLIARIEAVRSPVPGDTPPALPAIEPIDHHAGSILGRRHAGRAPPTAAAF